MNKRNGLPWVIGGGVLLIGGLVVGGLGLLDPLPCYMRRSDSLGVNMRASMQTTVAYEIEVAGLMDPAWEGWLEAANIQSSVRDGQPVTRLTVSCKDQAGLIGVLRQLHGMGLEILSLTRRETSM